MSPTYTGNPSLAERFWDLVNVGMPLAEAPALLFDLYITHHFYTMSGLSEIKDFWLDDDSNLVVELSDGSNPDPETVLTRDPYPHEEPTMALATVYGLHRTRMREKRWQAAEQEEMERRQAGAPRITPSKQPDPLKPVIPGGTAAITLMIFFWAGLGADFPFPGRRNIWPR